MADPLSPFQNYPKPSPINNATPPPTFTTKPPTVEVGHANPTFWPWLGYTGVIDTEIPDLVWPRSNKTYASMRNDGQIQSLIDAVVNPILGYSWYIDAGEASEEVTRFIAGDVGLPILGEDTPPTRLRSRMRFSFDQHMRDALLSLVYGYMFFELVAQVGEDGKAHIAKVAPRMPETIYVIKADYVGDMTSIVQISKGGASPQEILADKLVHYCWNQEGGNLVGRSMLRSIYRDWLAKDQDIRTMTIANMRNGMGIPVITAPTSADQDTMDTLADIASQMRAGEMVGSSFPAGTIVDLKGVSGSLPDILASIRYHDEQMARRFLAMFMQLGTTSSGSRSLGDTFSDFFAQQQETIARWFEATFNTWVIERMVDWNWGENEPAPRLCHIVNEGAEYSVDELQRLVLSGLIVVDDELREFIRTRGGLPKESETNEPISTEPAPEKAPLTVSERVAAYQQRPVPSAMATKNTVETQVSTSGPVAGPR